MLLVGYVNRDKLFATPPTDNDNEVVYLPARGGWGGWGGRGWRRRGHHRWR